MLKLVIILEAMAISIIVLAFSVFYYKYLEDQYQSNRHLILDRKYMNWLFQDISTLPSLSEDEFDDIDFPDDIEFSGEDFYIDARTLFDLENSLENFDGDD